MPCATFGRYANDVCSMYRDCALVFVYSAFSLTYGIGIRRAIRLGESTLPPYVEHGCEHMCPRECGGNVYWANSTVRSRLRRKNFMRSEDHLLDVCVCSSRDPQRACEVERTLRLLYKGRRCQDRAGGTAAALRSSEHLSVFGPIRSTAPSTLVDKSDISVDKFTTRGVSHCSPCHDQINAQETFALRR